MHFQDTTSDPRDLKAVRLIEEGKVHLTLGQKFAVVDGSNGEQYRVSRDGCGCKDWEHRQPEGGCCHMRSVRWLCGAYRMMVHRAKRHGRTRLPSALGRALRPVPVAPAIVCCEMLEAA